MDSTNYPVLYAKSISVCFLQYIAEPVYDFGVGVGFECVHFFFITSNFSFIEIVKFVIRRFYFWLHYRILQIDCADTIDKLIAPFYLH